MIFVLDTNVLSERIKKHPSPAVEDFLRRLPAENVRIPAVALAEIAQGVENNPTPELKRFLADILHFVVAPFGEEEALEWGRLTSEGLARGRVMTTRDAMIAATAKTHGWVVATRDEEDFRPLGVKVFNPWKEKL